MLEKLSMAAFTHMKGERSGESSQSNVALDPVKPLTESLF